MLAAGTDEHVSDATKTMLERTETCFRLKAAVACDGQRSWFRTDDRLLMQRQIEPHGPLLDHERQTKGFFTRADFIFRTEMGFSREVVAGLTL
jgi:hypothetical protein